MVKETGIKKYDGVIRDRESNGQSFEDQFDLLFNRQKDLQESLQYASLIQKGILPKERHLDRVCKDHFVFHKQRDLIGGDFYWVGKSSDTSFIAVGDCAGHGVPGALLSMLGQSLLNYYVLGKGISCVGEILSELDHRLLETFLPAGNDEHHHDWISLSICAVDHAQKKLSFAGAGQSMIYIDSQNKAHYVKGSRSPLGQLMRTGEYDVHSYNFESIRTCFLFSDGIPDQFGEISGKKITVRRLFNKIAEIAPLGIAMQCRILGDYFKDWQGDLEQTDDYTLVGFEI